MRPGCGGIELRSLPRLAAAGAAIACLLSLPACGAARGSAAPAPRFRQVAAESGIDFRHVNGATPRKYLVETMGSGVALFDYDNDGWLDLLFISGHRLDGGSQNCGSSLRLYRNLGRQPAGRPPLRFREVTVGAGLTARLYGMGCAVGDYDNDGWSDLYVSAVLGPGRLYRNEGVRFRNVTAAAGVGNPGRWGAGCAWLDYNRDGLLDLYVANCVRYTSLADDLPCFVAGDRRVYCIPVAYQGSAGRLYRNRGGGRFSDASAEAGLNDPGQKGLGVVATDLDDDSWPDLMVANDTAPNRLFHNHRGTFRESATLAGIAFGPNGQARGGMGIDAAEWKGDASRAIAITNFARESIGFYIRQRANPIVLLEESPAAGLAAPSVPYVGFGIRFFDLDNDGDEDLCAVNGHVRDDVETLQEGQTHAQPALLFRNGGAAFEQIRRAAGLPLSVPAVRRGLAAGDLDNDGRLDLVATQNGGPAEIWRNETAGGGHWIAITARGRNSGRDAIGARVTVEAGGRQFTRRVRSGGSYLSESDRRVHVGLGPAARIDGITVRWPSGRVQSYPGRGVDQRVVLEEAAAP